MSKMLDAEEVEIELSTYRAEINSHVEAHDNLYNKFLVIGKRLAETEEDNTYLIAVINKIGYTLNKYNQSDSKFDDTEQGMFIYKVF
jgi:hypothetical protein